MAVIEANFYVDLGVDFITNLDFNDDNGVPIDISENTFHASAKKVFSESVAFDVTVEYDPEGSDSNSAKITILGSNTQNLKPGKYYYDVLMIDAQSVKSKVLSGMIILLDTYTVIEE